jgi:acetylglutamate kinase
MEPADVVLRFLESVGRRSEYEFYLSLFRSEPKEQFAAITVDANVARYAMDAVVLHLRFLAALGLVPQVVLGLFEPTDALEHAQRIRRKLERGQVPVLQHAFDEGPAVADHAREAARAGTIPILTFSGARGGEAEGEARVARLGTHLAALQTRKLIFMHRPGGLRQKGEVVQNVNLTLDYPALVASKELSRKERAILTQSRRLVLELSPHKLTCAITSPLNLFRELFTTKGAGTLLRRGATIARHTSFEGLDRERLRALITSAFGRPPIEAVFERPISRIYLLDGYRGAAILVDTPLGGYLNKFVVDREAQGEGLGRELWDEVIADYRTVFWRARPQNPIVVWYDKLCDGMLRTADWIIYWRGLSPSQIPLAIEHTLAQPIDVPLESPSIGGAA